MTVTGSLIVTEHRLGLFATCLATCLLTASTARADLDAYVKEPDASFAWTHVNKRVSNAGTMYLFQLTSQTWQGAPWEHQLQIYEPAEVKYPDAMLLFITGGIQDSRPGPGDAANGFALARSCVPRCAVLPQVPTQPLMDGRKEDDLIAETFVK